MDRIKELACLICNHRNFKTITKEISKILLKLKIIQNKKSVIPVCLNSNTIDAAFACSIDSNKNVFGKKIYILIKPDHSEKRIIRVLIQIESSVWQKKEDEDNQRHDVKEVMEDEIEDALKDIKRYFRKHN